MVWKIATLNEFKATSQYSSEIIIKSASALSQGFETWCGHAVISSAYL